MARDGTAATASDGWERERGFLTETDNVMVTDLRRNIKHNIFGTSLILAVTKNKKLNFCKVVNTVQKISLSYTIDQLLTKSRL